jgi:hypothetical protein
LFHSYISAVRLADIFLKGFDYFKFVFRCADGYVQEDYRLKVVELVGLIGF